jgi:glycerol-3-phosphate dehydrogenase (NAD(P)+)
MSEPLKVGVVGAGTFGRAIARAIVQAGHDVVLYTRGEKHDEPGLDMTSSLADVARASLIFLAVPSVHVAEVARSLGQSLDGSHLLVHVSRGLLGEELEPLTRVLRRETPARRVGVLAGPLVAEALVRGEPSGAIVGSHFPEVAKAVRTALSGKNMMVFDTDDVVGVEVASAFVGIIALSVGLARGLGFGPGSLSVLTTRGIYEGARVASRLGGDVRTLGGLAGMADLVAVVAGDERPEERLGRAIAQGQSPNAAIAALGTYVEGVLLLEHLLPWAKRESVSLPICHAVAGVLAGRLSPPAAVAALMARRAGRE